MAQSLWWSFLAGACTVIGAAVLFVSRDWGKRSLAFFLGLASGVMIAVVVFDLLPSILFFPHRIKGMAGFIFGLAAMWLINRHLLTPEAAGQNLRRLGYLIMLGIALHDLPEGMAIAFGEEMKARTGLIIALGIGIHNIPEGMAIAAPLLMDGVKKTRVLLQTVIVALITPLGTLMGRYAVSIVPDMLPAMLGVAAGIMIYLVASQLWPQAGINDTRSRRWGLVIGMIIIFTGTYLI